MFLLCVDSMTARKRTGACSAVLGEMIFIIGGYDGDQVTNTVEKYENQLFTMETDDEKLTSKDRKSGKEVADMNNPRTGARAVDHKGRIYVIGGDTGQGPTKTCEVYDPETNTWTFFPEMKYERKDFRAAVVHNRILVVGGYIGGCATDVIELYDIKTEAWVACEQLAQPRANLAMATVRVEFLEEGVVEKIKFRGDVLIEKTRRINLPIQEHFNWT